MQTLFSTHPRKSPASVPAGGPTDAQLWDQFRGGEERAFARIYQDHAKVLFTYGMRLVRDGAMIEDCIHDLFIDLWDRKEHLSPTDSIRLYLLKSLKRKVIRAAAKKHKLVLQDGSEAGYAFPFELSHEALLIQQQLSAEQAERLKQGIAKLTSNQQEIIFLRFYAGLPYEEIGSLLAINYQSVKNLMFRAMKTLRQSLTIGFVLLTLLFPR